MHEKDGKKSKVFAYLRVFTGRQDLKSQLLELLSYARKNEFKINEFVEVEISSRRTPEARKIDALLERLNVRLSVDRRTLQAWQKRRPGDKDCGSAHKKAGPLCGGQREYKIERQT